MRLNTRIPVIALIAAILPLGACTQDGGGDTPTTAASNDTAVHSAEVAVAGRDELIAKGETKSAVRLKSGINADLRVVSDKEFPFALLHFTGSKEHNVAGLIDLGRAEFGVDLRFRGHRVTARDAGTRSDQVDNIPPGPGHGEAIERAMSVIGGIVIGLRRNYAAVDIAACERGNGGVTDAAQHRTVGVKHQA